MSATPSEATRAFRRLRRHDLPELLRQIHDPPRALFLRGLAPPEVLAKPAVAVVGARACSPYGAQVARMLGRELAAAGLVVVSGLARGVDGEAHRGALEATGLTVAVLGCGIDRDYPAAHAELARRICERGLVVSEYEPGVEPAPWRFPARNRIIAGLAAVTVIVEARERSGALITADFALEGGREVFAVPGEITGSLANGTNRLLRQGATPLTSTEDVLELFGLAASQRPRAPTVGATAAAVLEHLADGAASADELARATGLEPGPVAAALMELELAGLTVEADGRYRGWCGQTTSIVDIESSYWLEDERPTFPTRRHSGRVDVAIVGAGVTGCSCALALAQAGLRVRVHEAREVAGGASGRNGGFALRGSAAPYDVARAKLGPERAASLWRLTERALGQLADLAGDAFRRTGSLRLATNAAEADVLAAECAALREDGFAAELQTALDPPLAGRFDAALVHPPDGAISPARWARRLAALAAEAGAEIREQTPVRDLGELEAEQIVLATDGYTEGLLAELDAAVHPTRGQVIATAPLATARYPRPHYTYDGIRYWHQTDEGRLILGGFRDLALAEESTREEATTPTIQVALESFASDLLGEKPKITHRWAGIFGATADQLPLVGRVPSDDRVWVSCGYSGHGNVLGLACGELVAEAILGRPAPELELFDPARVLRAASPTS